MGCVYRVRLETTAQSCAVTRSTSKLAKRSDRYRQSRRLHSERNWNAVSFLQRAVHPLEINNGWWRRRTSVNFSKILLAAYCLRLTIGEFFNPRAKLVALQANHSIFRRFYTSFNYRRASSKVYSRHVAFVPSAIIRLWNSKCTSAQFSEWFRITVFYSERMILLKYLKI